MSGKGGRGRRWASGGGRRRGRGLGELSKVLERREGEELEQGARGRHWVGSKHLPHNSPTPCPPLPLSPLSDLRANTEYSGYTTASPVIRWFWEAVGEMSAEDQALLLQFVTGTSKVPLEGFKALQGIGGPQKFQIHKVGAGRRGGSKGEGAGLGQQGEGRGAAGHWRAADLPDTQGRSRRRAGRRERGWGGGYGEGGRRIGSVCIGTEEGGEVQSREGALPLRNHTQCLSTLHTSTLILSTAAGDI